MLGPPRPKSPRPVGAGPLRRSGADAQARRQRRTSASTSASIDPHVANRALLAFVAVRTNEYGPEQPSAKALAQLPDVLEIHHVAGEDCFLLKVRARDAEHLGQMLRRQIASVPGVTSTRTTIVLETVKETSRIPIARNES